MGRPNCRNSPGPGKTSMHDGRRLTQVSRRLNRIPVRRAVTVEALVVVRLGRLAPAGVGLLPALRGQDRRVVRVGRAGAGRRLRRIHRLLPITAAGVPRLTAAGPAPRPGFWRSGGYRPGQAPVSLAARPGPPGRTDRDGHAESPRGGISGVVG